MSPDKYVMGDSGLLHNVVRDNDELFLLLVGPLALTKYILH